MICYSIREKTRDSRRKLQAGRTPGKNGAGGQPSGAPLPADHADAVLPEASKEQLRQLLTPEDYQALFSHPEDRLEIRFFFPQLLETLRAAYSAAR